MEMGWQWEIIYVCLTVMEIWNGNYTDKEFYNDIKDKKCKLFVFF